MRTEVPSQFCKIVDVESGEIVGLGLFPQDTSITTRRFFLDFENAALLGKDGLTLQARSLETTGLGPYVARTLISSEEADSISKFMEQEVTIEVHNLPPLPSFDIAGDGVQFITDRVTTGNVSLEYVQVGERSIRGE